MSFRVTGRVNTARLGFTRGYADALSGEVRDALNIVRQEGEEFLRTMIEDEAYDTGAMARSALGGTNQTTVWFSLKIAPDDERPDAPYSVYQNRGWTDRGGAFHPGHFFMERTEEYAQNRLLVHVQGALRQYGFRAPTMPAPTGFENPLNPGMTMVRAGTFTAAGRAQVGQIIRQQRRDAAANLATARAAYQAALRLKDTKTRATRDIISR